MFVSCGLPRPERLNSLKEQKDIISNHIKQKFSKSCSLNILEAGCGRKWDLNLKGIKYVLTGVDVDKNALYIRKEQRGDLDIAIHGDLRTVDLKKNQYDIIYSSNVLEHVDGAEKIADKFVSWLRPGGILVLVIPNRDSVKGFVTRKTPYWFHLFYKKYIQKTKNAGKPGFDPYPTFFNKIVSRKGIYEFCEKHDLSIVLEYSYGHYFNMKWIFQFLCNFFVFVIYSASLGRLSINDADLVYIIEKN